MLQVDACIIPRSQDKLGQCLRWTSEFIMQPVSVVGYHGSAMYAAPPKKNPYYEVHWKVVDAKEDHLFRKRSCMTVHRLAWAS